MLSGLTLSRPYLISASSLLSQVSSNTFATKHVDNYKLALKKSQISPKQGLLQQKLNLD